MEFSSRLLMLFWRGGGYVYGASYSKDWTVVHNVSSDINDCIKYQGSKYVQSDISGMFDDIKDKLASGQQVLFTGTPCQVAAVKSFLLQKKIDTRNLLTIDILCYGVPSPQLWGDHIRYLETKYGMLKEYNFRDEREGWSSTKYHCARFEGAKELYKNKELQAFGSLFGTHENMRESCFSCRYSDIHRCADITIGDCWGIEHINKAFYDIHGVSQVLINTEKGKNFWDSIAGCFDIVEADIEEIKKYNSVLSYPAEKPDGYEKFWSDYNQFGFDYIMKRYTMMGKTFRIRQKVKRVLKSILAH